MTKISMVIISLLLTLVATTSACPYETSGHYTAIRVLDVIPPESNGGVWYVPVHNATVMAEGIEKKQTYFWEIFGITPNFSIDLISHNATTDSRGVVIFPLYAVQQYNITIVTNDGRTAMFKIYPNDPEYTLYMGKL